MKKVKIFKNIVFVLSILMFLVLFGQTAFAVSSFAQEQKLTASDASTNEYFGQSVSISGDGSRMVVGAYADSPNGAAYVFSRSGTTWTEEQKLTASDGAPGDSFGYAVSISFDGSRLVVGAYGANSSKGAAYVFSRSGTAWTQEQKLTASDGASHEDFGYSVSISSDSSRLVAGALFANSSKGAAYVFSRSGTAWTQEQKLTASDGSVNDYFSFSLSISSNGSRVVVGAYRNSFSKGVAYVFSRSGITWTEEQELTASNGANSNNFGVSVSLSSDSARLAVGASGAGGSSKGAVYIFSRSGTTWTEEQEVTKDLVPGAGLGVSVSISSDGLRLVAGASGVAGGVAVVFSRSGITWTEYEYLFALDPTGADEFGRAVSISSIGSRVVIGAPGVSTHTGAVYVFYENDLNNATISSDTYTVSAGGTNSETIANVSYGTSKTDFLANLTKNQPDQTWDDTGVHSTVVTGDTLVVTSQDTTSTVTYTVTVNAISSVATITSSAYIISTVGGGAETITNISYGTLKAAFLANLVEGDFTQTWNSTGIHSTVVTGDALVVTAQDGTTQITYTATVNAQNFIPFSLSQVDIGLGDAPSESSFSDDYTYQKNISANNRYIVFQSEANNLVTQDVGSDGFDNVYFRDLQTGTTTLVSVATNGTDGGNDYSYYPSISADGRYVVFASDATNLIDGDTNGSTDIFVRDMQNNTTVRVSVSTGGTEGNGKSNTPAISGDGKYVAFGSSSDNLTADSSTGNGDIFLHNMQTGATTLVSVATNGTEGGDGFSQYPSVSDDGKYIAFQSSSSNLTADQINVSAFSPNVFLRDVQAGSTTLISIANDNSGSGNRDGSYLPSISSDGRYIVFISSSSNLVTQSTSGNGDIFLRDTIAGTTTLISIAINGTEGGNFGSSYPSISSDGKYIAFQSSATNLGTQTSGNGDIFFRNTVSGTTNMISVATDGTLGDSNSNNPSISPDGLYVAYSSYATNLFPPVVGPGQGNYFLVQARSNIVTHILTYTAGAHGSITGTSPQTVNDGADGSAVTAVADSGYHFTSWSDDVLTASRTDTNITGDVTVAASFAADVSTNTNSNSNGGGGFLPPVVTVCNPGDKFSTTTGQPCTSFVADTVVSCPTGDLFSVTTGKPCTSFTNGGPVTNPPPPACSITATLMLGSKGAQVKCLQTILKISADGLFGFKTKTAVIAFQKLHKLLPDGIVGPATRAKIKLLNL